MLEDDDVQDFIDALRPILTDGFSKLLYQPPKRTLTSGRVFKTIDGVSVGAGIPACKRDKPPVVFVHGNGSDLFSLAPFLQRCAEKWGTVVVGFDYPGYGEMPGPCSEEGCCEALRRVLRWAHRTWPRVVVLGHSLESTTSLSS